jgi:hypothetical protein
MSKIEHYLMTIDVGNAHLHGYLMTADESDMTKIIDKMMQIAEENTQGFLLPIILSTKLGDGAQVVRDMLGEMSEELKQTLDKARNFHVSVFVMHKENPSDARLMELH